MEINDTSYVLIFVWCNYVHMLMSIPVQILVNEVGTLNKICNV